jgi:hypothetical protein
MQGKGAQMRTGTPPSPVEKSRSITVPSRGARGAPSSTPAAARWRLGCAPGAATGGDRLAIAAIMAAVNRLENSGTRGASPCFFARVETPAVSTAAFDRDQTAMSGSSRDPSMRRG